MFRQRPLIVTPQLVCHNQRLSLQQHFRIMLIYFRVDSLLVSAERLRVAISVIVRARARVTPRLGVGQHLSTRQHALSLPVQRRVALAAVCSATVHCLFFLICFFCGAAAPPARPRLAVFTLRAFTPETAAACCDQHCCCRCPWPPHLRVMNSASTQHGEFSAARARTLSDQTRHYCIVICCKLGKPCGGGCLTDELHEYISASVMQEHSQLPATCATAVFSLCQQSSWSRGSPKAPLGCFDSLIHSN